MIAVGTLVKADILMGDVSSGAAAGLLEEYVLLGVGSVDMSLVYEPHELTDSYRPGDTVLAAVVIRSSGGSGQ